MLRDNYREDIDGLRAVAVLLVMFDHLGLSFASSGFIGVDVFFVISGFLITSHILKDIEADRFTLSGFYLKRMRRILPALMTVLFFTSLAAYLLLVGPDLRLYVNALVPTTLSLPNIFFWFKSVGYLGLQGSTFPLLHTWSLGVEEQFYIVWPLALILLSQYLAKTKIIFAILGLATLSFCTYYYLKSDTILVYYSPFTRAFQLLIGAGIASLYGVIKWPENLLLNHVLSGIGLASIIVAGIVLDEKAYPGFAALLPCFGAALLILTGRHSRDAIGNKMLSNGTLVFIGTISYSLYLWHWPIIAFFNYLHIPLSIYLVCFIFLISIALAWGTWLFIEKPFRFKFKFSFDRTIIIFFILPLILSLVLNLSLRRSADSFGFNDVSMPGNFVVGSGPIRPSYGCSDGPINSTMKNLCVIGDISRERSSVILAGDSHAASDIGFVNSLLMNAGQKGFVTTQGSTPFLLDASSDKGKGRAAFKAKNDAIGKDIEEWGYQYVVLAAEWSNYSNLVYKERASKHPYESLEKSLAQTIAFIIDNDAIPVLILDTPNLLDLPFYCGLANIAPKMACWNQESEILAEQMVSRTIVIKMKERFPSVILIDPSKIICRDSKCYTALEGTPLYKDSNHLTYTGSTLIGSLYVRDYGNPFGPPQ